MSDFYDDFPIVDAHHHLWDLEGDGHCALSENETVALVVMLKPFPGSPLLQNQKTSVFADFGRLGAIHAAARREYDHGQKWRKSDEGVKAWLTGSYRSRRLVGCGRRAIAT
jgi:hypothetical protein